MTVKGNFNFFFNEEKRTIEEIEKLVDRTTTVSVKGLDVFYSSPKKEIKTMNRLVEEELEKQETESPFDYDFADIKLPKEEGVKTNKNKPQLSILFTQFPRALEAIAKCSKYGHLKYKNTDCDYLNYQRVEGGSKTYADAGLRHRLYKKGTTDIESRLPHAYHVAWNALAELQIWIMENE